MISSPFVGRCRRPDEYETAGQLSGGHPSDESVVSLNISDKKVSKNPRKLDFTLLLPYEASYYLMKVKENLLFKLYNSIKSRGTTFPIKKVIKIHVNSISLSYSLTKPLKPDKMEVKQLIR